MARLLVYDWLVHTRTFKRVHGREGGATGMDEDFAARGRAGIGAWMLGRNMFGPTTHFRSCWPAEPSSGIDR